MSVIIRQNRLREFDQRLRNATLAGLIRAGSHYKVQCQLAVSQPNTDHYVSKSKDAKGKTHRKKRYKNMHNALSGRPPRTRTRFGARHILMEHNGNRHDPAVRVGVGKAGMYMIYLELGTRRVRPFPWLIPTLQKNLRAISILAVTTAGRRVGR